ncbi:hypothetical protein ACIRST_20025 [Kitasatospora sp. NPDC101447]|uniref:hypothetical protein n=1 Tax=Kitasatospora sp. NPDC101447 TaxID=3364102 RepID=UPI00382D3611
MPKKGPKGEYAESTPEAESILRNYCQSISFDPEGLSDKDWTAVVRVACDPREGLDPARQILSDDKIQELRGAAQAVRQARLDADSADLLNQIQADGQFNGSHVEDILNQFCHSYVAAGERNPTLSVEYNGADYETLRTLWAAAQGICNDAVAAGAVHPFFTNFHSSPAQNKQAAGKGNVGATLDSRTWQGNLLVNLGGATFNMHINIKN